AQAGVPVVANDIDVLRETLAVGGRPCALFVNANDTGAFATAVQRLVEDRQLAAALASRGTQLSQRYSLGAMVERYAGLIEAVARRSWRPVKAWPRLGGADPTRTRRLTPADKGPAREAGGKGRGPGG